MSPGVENPGVNEQLAYRLQSLLSAPELQVWMPLANAIDISDVALNELGLHSTSGTLSRHSCSPETRPCSFDAVNTSGASSATRAAPHPAAAPGGRHQHARRSSSQTTLGPHQHAMGWSRRWSLPASGPVEQ